MPSKIDVTDYRKPDYDIDPLFIERWSPRAMSGEEIPESDLMSLFEAARWAPSSYNSQPWRFVYARRNTPHWETLFNLMIDFNKQWAGNAAALVAVISKTTFEHNGKPSRTHSFDTGAAWANLALQGARMGLVIHAMSGIDYNNAATSLGVPEGYSVEAMIAIGRPGDSGDLPGDMAESELPSGRKPVTDFVFEGKFKG